LGAKDHREQHRRFGSERGAASTTNLVVIAVVIVAGLVSVTLLARTTRAANRINAKAERIAKTGQGINIATDSVIQLNRTNETAKSILASATPIESKLGQIVGQAQSVDGLATSINGTAGTINATGSRINTTAAEINTTAGRINKTAKDINTTVKTIAGSAGSINTSAVKINATAKDINVQAAAILNVARRINDDVAQINKDLDGTVGLAQAIKGDTANILGEAQKAQQYADCIDKRIGVATPCP
jgi:methyl-accepting chemotaxis protein